MQIAQETNSQSAKVEGNLTSKPRKNSVVDIKIVLKEKKRDRRKKFMDDSIRDAKSNRKNWRQLRKNVKLAFKLRKKVKNFHHKNSEKSLQIPPTPHNTGQFLISNYCQGRHEKLFNYNSDYLHREVYSNLIENAAMDDLCVSGGTMKGIINSHLFRRDSDDFSTHFSITNNNHSLVTDEDISNAPGDYGVNYLNSDHSHFTDFVCENLAVVQEDLEQPQRESLEARLCRQKIQEQNKLIELLIHRIKSQNG